MIKKDFLADKLNASQYRRLKLGEVLFVEGDFGDDVYVVKTGKVRLVRRQGCQMEVLGYVSPGEIFGELGALGDHVRLATAQADVETTIGVLSREYLDQQFSSFPNWLMSLLQCLTTRIRKTISLQQRMLFVNALPCLLHILICHFPEDQSEFRIAVAVLCREVSLINGLLEQDVAKLIRLICPDIGRLEGILEHQTLVIVNCSRIERWLMWLEAPQPAQFSPTEMELFQSLAARLN